MALTPGTRLGSYEITNAIGAGGMGEVYRAHDARLRRDVAIKVLPASVAGDPDRLRRFEQEALATAALNHPNILAVYDVGREGQTAFVVEELLEGETLREKLSAALPVRKVVDYAIQIANGLAAAHEKGIVHRDLKPENIFLTRDERVKILDFGLAKTITSPSSATSTELAGSTEPGMVLGTLGYMAPEQVRAQTVDHRADIFSLGTVLYEMLSGRRAFHGETTADTMTAILKETPPELTESGRAIPPALDRVVSRCLEKSPGRRFQSASDLAFALQSLSTDSRAISGPAIAAAPPVRVPRVLPIAASLAAGIAVGAIAFALWRSPDAARAGERVRFSISLADGIGIDDLTRAAVSPDGRLIALTEGVGNGRRVAVLSLRDGAKRDLGEVAGPGAVCWSPDGQWLAYFGADRALYKVEVATGQRQRLAPLVWAPNAASWSVDGNIYVVGSVATTMMTVPSSGGEAREIAAADTTSSWISVQALSDGKRLLLSRAASGEPEMVLATADGSQAPRVIGRGAYPQFIAPDSLLALRGSQIVLWRTPLDGGMVSGEPTVLADGVLIRTGTGMMPLSATPNVLLYRAESQETRTRLAWFDRKGVEGTALAIQRHCRNPEFSPDYGRVAIECWESSGGRDIWVYDLARDALARLTSDPGDDADPVWMPDGRTILFASSRQGPPDVFKIGAGGGSAEELVVKTAGATPTMGISPDGKDLILLTPNFGSNTGLDLALYRLGSGTAAALTPMLQGPASEIEGQFSSDGKYFLYASNHSGKYEVYVEPWPRTGERWAVSTDGGTDARWRPDGLEIFYLSPDRRLMAVPVRTAGGFSVGRSVELFRTRVAGPVGTGHRFPFAVAKDGQRFLMYVTDPNAAPPGVTVIANWK
ncbi:MAG: protein kinase domain-containing protein [Acidobacteriota bacterium]